MTAYFDNHSSACRTLSAQYRNGERPYEDLEAALFEIEHQLARDCGLCVIQPMFPVDLRQAYYAILLTYGLHAIRSHQVVQSPLVDYETLDQYAVNLDRLISALHGLWHHVSHTVRGTEAEGFFTDDPRSPIDQLLGDVQQGLENHAAALGRFVAMRDGCMDVADRDRITKVLSKLTHDKPALLATRYRIEGEGYELLGEGTRKAFFEECRKSGPPPTTLLATVGKAKVVKAKDEVPERMRIRILWVLSEAERNWTTPPGPGLTMGGISRALRAHGWGDDLDPVGAKTVKLRVVMRTLYKRPLSKRSWVDLRYGDTAHFRYVLTPAGRRALKRQLDATWWR